MATFNKFDCFVGDLGLKLHNLNTDTLKVYLTNVQPVAGNTVFGTPAEITAKNLIGWWYRGSATTVLLDETITLDMTDNLATIQ